MRKTLTHEQIAALYKNDRKKIIVDVKSMFNLDDLKKEDYKTIIHLQ